MSDFSGLNFYEFEHYIRQLLGKVGYDHLDCRGRDETAIQLGAMEFLRCPFKIEDINRIVNKVREKRG